MSITDAQRQTAVKYALAQVGKPYLFASTGPDAFDCSGLIVAAWRAAGVTVPHNSEQQAQPWLNPSCRFVANHYENAVKAKFGDLLIYYPDWSHVAMFTNLEYPGAWWRVTQATNEQRGVENIRAAAYATAVGIVYMGHD